MVEIGVLAVSLVSSFLVPLIKSGAEGLAEELKKRTTDAAADGLVSTAKRLWQRVRGKAQGTDDQQVIELFERKPEVMKGALEEVVKQMLESDPDFRKEASELLEAKEGGTTRWQLMGEIVGAVDARGATISGGTVAGVVYGGDVPRVPRRPESSSGS